MSKIIDISKYNTINNWNEVEKNVDGIFIRVGYRGYSVGKIVEDEKFNANVRECISHDIPFGFYFMSQAINETEGCQEADFCVDMARRYKPSLPIFVDSEDGDGKATLTRADRLNKTTRTKVIDAFCRTIKSAGYETGVYASESWFKEQLNYNRLSQNYLIWVAKYGKNDGSITDITLPTYYMHQFTSRGFISGIKGNVDISEYGMKFENGRNKHVQLNYKVAKHYRTTVNLNVRNIMVDGKIIETLEKGSVVVNNATSRFGEQIWMMIGADRWVCADNGFCAYLEEIQQTEKHIQINYKANNSYISTVNLNVRVKPHGKIVDSLPIGTIQKNLATTRIGDEIWMNIGRNKWICADNGKKSYMV